jgi:hypothetical protein
MQSAFVVDLLDEARKVLDDVSERFVRHRERLVVFMPKPLTSSEIGLAFLDLFCYCSRCGNDCR